MKNNRHDKRGCRRWPARASPTEYIQLLYDASGQNQPFVPICNIKVSHGQIRYPGARTVTNRIYPITVRHLRAESTICTPFAILGSYGCVSDRYIQGGHGWGCLSTPRMPGQAGVAAFCESILCLSVETLGPTRPRSCLCAKDGDRCHQVFRDV